MIWSEKLLHIKYYIQYTYNLKKSLEFKSLAFWRKQFPFIAQKCTYEKVPKNLGRALPPHLDKIQKNSSIFSWNRPEDDIKIPI